MKTGDFDYVLPPELIAQTPVDPRDSSRLMVLDRTAKSVGHRRFSELPDFIRAGDVLVFNDTRVIPARLAARKDTGAKLEVLLLHRVGINKWQTLVRPAKRLPIGSRLTVVPSGQNMSASRPAEAEIRAEVVEAEDGGIRVLAFDDEQSLFSLGTVPLPPYIHEPLRDPNRYQTVYSRVDGSAAAPTAGLHFTPEMIDGLRRGGVRCVFVTLHVGLDTFRPVREDDPLAHRMHREFGIVSGEAALELSMAKAEGRRVVVVGTTAMRLVEAAAQSDALKRGHGFSGWVDLFILPGYRFSVADAMITNFHLPKTTLLMLVLAFAGREFILKAYEDAVRENYRFYSFGDAMLIV